MTQQRRTSGIVYAVNCTLCDRRLLCHCAEQLGRPRKLHVAPGTVHSHRDRPRNRRGAFCALGSARRTLQRSALHAGLPHPNTCMHLRRRTRRRTHTRTHCTFPNTYTHTHTPFVRGWVQWMGGEGVKAAMIAHRASKRRSSQSSSRRTERRQRRPHQVRCNMQPSTGIQQTTLTQRRPHGRPMEAANTVGSKCALFEREDCALCTMRRSQQYRAGCRLQHAAHKARSVMCIALICFVRRV